MNTDQARFSQAITEAANRAEATALLIRAGYRVYRPEADIEGEDLVIRVPAETALLTGELRGVQLKGRPVVDERRYGGRDLWMLFPSTRYNAEVAREWFLVPHDHLFAWVENRHGSAPKWDRYWSYPSISKPLASFLAEYVVKPLDPNGMRFVETGESATITDVDGNPVNFDERIG